MTVFYVSKNALTAGIKKRGDLRKLDDGYVYGKPGWGTYKLGSECYETFEEAKADADNRRNKKIESLQRQIENLKKLDFPEPK
jgi:hypothetical protein